MLDFINKYSIHRYEALKYPGLQMNVYFGYEFLKKESWYIIQFSQEATRSYFAIDLHQSFLVFKMVHMTKKSLILLPPFHVPHFVTHKYVTKVH